MRRTTVHSTGLDVGIVALRCPRRFVEPESRVRSTGFRDECLSQHWFASLAHLRSPEVDAHWSVFLAKSYQLWLTPVVIDASDLKAIQAPVLVIAGDKDFSSVEDTAAIYRGLARAQLFIVPGAGHGTFSDRPELVDLAIRQFLEKP